MDAEALVRPVIEAAGLDVVEVAMRREGGRRILRVIVDAEGGADLETIAEVSEKVSRRLDLEGFAPGPYALEVSSPGLERPLRRPADFRRRVGDTVRVRTRVAVDGRMSFTGALASADDDEISIGTADGERRVRYADIVSARTVVDWDAELRGSTR